MQVRINYVEIPVKDVATSKDFFSRAFGWEFVDYGPDYCSVTNAGIDAGMFTSDQTVSTESGSVLLVMFHDDLEGIRDHIQACGGDIIKPIFSFPGGRRFHFTDLNDNEYAVWSDK